eukprot:m.51046 g.51046  ORF g.51046 m.51046 type:complete len:128 (-) comp9035_c0_seq1:2390-2773(-)
MDEVDVLDYGEDGGGVAEMTTDASAANSGHGEVDLYADLAGVTEVSENQESYLELQQRADAATASNKKLTRQVALLQKKADILTKQNNTLKKNISCLYKTARLELDRKDAEIQRLKSTGEQATPRPL